MRARSPISIRKRTIDGGLAIAPAAAGAVVGRCSSSGIFHAGKIFLVILDSSPHLWHGIPFGYEPRAEDGRHFTHITEAEPVEAHAVDF
jgi:hypothetical protein